MSTVKKTSTSKSKQIKSILDSVKSLTPDSIVAEVGSLQVSLQNTLANISANITDKIEKMNQVDDAINLKEQRIAELYEIEKEALALEEIRDLKSVEEKELDTKIAAKKKAWQEEEEERNRKWKREKEEYEYVTSIENKRKIDEFQSEVILLKRDETLRSERLQREWQEREDILKSKETEFVELKNKVTNFDKNLQSEVTKAESILSNKLKKEYDYQIQLLDKDVNSERKLHEAQVASLNNVISNLSDQLEEVQKQLEVSRRDAKEVTEKALESASNKNVAEALQSMNQSSLKKN